MHKLWKSNGSVQHSYKTGDHIISTPAHYNDTIYFGSLDYYLYALDAGDLSFKWKYLTGDLVYSSPAIAGGRVYFTSMDAKVYCLNADDGSDVWNYTMGGATWASCSIVDGILYTGALDHKVYAIGIPDTDPPGVLGTSPSADATDVPVTSTVWVTFDEAMDPDSLTGSRLTLVDDGPQAVPGTISYKAATKRLTFTPDSPLDRSGGSRR